MKILRYTTVLLLAPPVILLFLMLVVLSLAFAALLDLIGRLLD